MAAEGSPPPLHTTEFSAPESAVASALQAPARAPVMGTRGAVASGQAIATTIGVDVLRAGGNAVDAALAVSAAMAVLQPYSSHLGGDAFVQVRTPDGETVALNAGGRAPQAATLDRYAGGVPLRGASAVAVPGLVDAWCELHSRFASRPLRELLAPAATLAREGFAVSHALSLSIRGAQDVLAADPGCAALLLSKGVPAPGSTLRQPDLARTIESIGDGGRDAFYRGQTGARIATTMRELGGSIAPEDLERGQAVWGEPLRISYRDWTVTEQPLPSQGYLALQALKTIEGFDLEGEPLASSEAVHRSAEAMRLAFLERRRYAGDPDFVDVPVERLLSAEHASELRAQIDARAGAAKVSAHGGDTTSFAVADGNGYLVSFIQSVFAVWGAAVVVPGTGVFFNNRMRGFSLDPESPNVLASGKRALHTLNTWTLERDGLVFAGGTPGADFQVQTNVQLISALADRRLNAQWAIDAPKWALLTDGALGLEARFPSETFAALESRGHRVVRLPAWAPGLCRSQIVGRTRSGAVFAATDPRGEGSALAW